MKKTLIALAVAGFSVNALAADLTVSPVVPAKYASEIVLPAVLTDAATDLDTTFALGFSATAGVKRYVRFDLTNAVFETAVTAADLDLAAPDVLVLDPADSSVSVGGAKGDSFVVFEITPKDAIANTDKLVFALADIKATGGNASIQYRLYETGVDAANATANTLATKSGALFNFEKGLIAEVATKGADKKIDVTAESKLFTAADTDEAEIGVLNIDVATVLAADGTALGLDDLLASATVEVFGDFSAGVKDGNGDLDPTAALLLDNAAATSLTGSKAVYAFDPATGFTAGGALDFTVDGETAMDTQSITAKFVPVANTGYSLSTVDLGVVGDLEKNGATQTVNLALKPGGAFSNFVRISNTSGLAGNFFITVIADDGQQASFPLSAVAGQAASIDARASSTQMSIQQIFDAAAAKGLNLSGEGKLRLVVEGEVPSLDVQTYTVSKDGNSFATF